MSGLPTITESSESKIRLTKRKLEDAFHVIDSTVIHNDNTDRPPPLKRSNTIKSLYSTLAKYGVKTKEQSPTIQSQSTFLTKSTPNLNAILSRAASKTKSSFSFRVSSHSPTPFLPATAEYRPSSLPSFLSRLATYKLSTYANKPPAIDAVAASKCGWINDGKDRLVCGLCHASWVVSGREGLNREAANALIEKQRVSLVDAHKNGCPWKTRQCDDSIYCIPLQAPGAMIREIKDRAAVMEHVIKDVLIKHPLSTKQLNAFMSTIASYTNPNIPLNASPDEVDFLPSETALLAALFGWSLVPLAAPQPFRRVSTTRANSVSSAAPSPPYSRASSVALSQTPAPGTSLSSSSSPSAPERRSSKFTFQLPSSVTRNPENALLQCSLCQRRIGLWSFTNRVTTTSTSMTNIPSNNGNMTEGAEGSLSTGLPATPSRPKKSLPQRAFDLLKEHRSYCPYTVRSTVVPSLPLPPQPSTTPSTPAKSQAAPFILNGNKNTSTTSLFQLTGSSANVGGIPGALEGWRGVLTVVLRYGMAEKQRIEYSFLAPRENVLGEEGLDDDEDRMEVDNVKAMVNGVKARGGRDLLKYVKGLLG